MKKTHDKSLDALRAVGPPGRSAAELRRRAEERLGESKTKAARSRTKEETQRLFHELQVHQVELEMQNEELRQARAEVEAGLKRYTDLYDFAPVGYLTLARDGAIRQVNLTGARLLGMERSRLVNRRLGLFVSDEARPAFNAFLGKVFENNAKKVCEVALLQEGNHPLLARIEAEASEAGQDCYAVVIDITEPKRAEETLRTEREKLETVTQNMGAGLAFISKDYRIIWANKVLKQTFGAIEGEICHWTYNKRNEICPGCGVREIFEKGSEKVVHEQEGKDLDGNTIWSEIVATSVKDKDGNITAALELVIPITERKKLEAQLRQAQKMEAIGQLAGGIAHDFNNALTLIKAYSQLTLFDLKESDPLREKIEMILEATNRSADLAHRLLAFSRRQVMEMKVLDLNNLLKDLDKMLHRVIGEDIELVNVLAEDLGRVKVDPGQVEQVVLNLALNAKDAMPRGGKLTIETANVELDETYSRTHGDVIPGRYVMLAVSDTGIGMTPEIKNRLFEPFFTTKEKGKGTGLGLAMVYGIVKQSGGNIWVYSEAGMGTTFKVYLPRVDEPLEEKKKRKLSEGKLPRGGETVLAVEDNKDVRRLAAQILKRQGYRVLEAANGGEALLVCEKLKEEIHLLLTDVVMPGMSGQELAQRLSVLRPEMKILYMSGYSDDSIASYGILNEKVGFIPKPFSLEALVNRVREVLDK